VVRIHDRPLPLEVRPLRGHDDFERFASYRRTAGWPTPASAAFGLVQDVRVAEVLRDGEQKRLVLCELGDGALCLVVQLVVAV
jgi:hypothetical protein